MEVAEDLDKDFVHEASVHSSCWGQGLLHFFLKRTGRRAACYIKKRRVPRQAKYKHEKSSTHRG
jgi:hypothetical protein